MGFKKHCNDPDCLGRGCRVALTIAFTLLSRVARPSFAWAGFCRLHPFTQTLIHIRLFTCEARSLPLLQMLPGFERGF